VIGRSPARVGPSSTSKELVDLFQLWEQSLRIKKGEEVVGLSHRVIVSNHRLIVQAFGEVMV
jgi:hypothetical protein